MIKELLKKLWTGLKKVKWGWGALFAVYGFVMYFRLTELFGSRLLGAGVVYLALLIVAKVMKK